MKLKIMPSVFVQMDINEKAFVIACINEQIEAEKKEERILKRNAGKGKKGRRRNNAFYKYSNKSNRQNGLDLFSI